MEAKAFFTRPACNEGIKIPLLDPATGKDSGEWVLIRGIDSDEFRKKEADIKRRIATSEDIADKQDALEAELIASLIIDWSLDDECNEDNKLELCLNAPLISQDINIKAAQRRLFLEKK